MNFALPRIEGLPVAARKSIALVGGHSGAEVVLVTDDSDTFVRKTAHTPFGSNRLLQQGTKQRLFAAQGLAFPHVRKTDLYAVWQKLDAAGLGTANLDRIGDIIACPGLDYCSLANARSIPVAQKISQRFATQERSDDLGELKLKISGCINACGHHHAGHIGILGVDRKGVENYQLLLGGSEGADTSLGQITGPGFSEDGIVDAVEKATEVYLAQRQEGERFLDTYRRIGMAPFKEAIYG